MKLRLLSNLVLVPTECQYRQFFSKSVNTSTDRQESTYKMCTEYVQKGGRTDINNLII